MLDSDLLFLVAIACWITALTVAIALCRSAAIGDQQAQACRRREPFTEEARDRATERLRGDCR